MTKAIFLDLDGTVLNSQNQITSKTVSSIKKIAKNGYEVFLITGKSFLNSKEVYEKLNLQTELITYGGQVLSKKVGNKYVHEKTFLNFLDIQAILNEPIIEDKLQHFLIETENVLFTSKQRNNFVIELLKSKEQKISSFENYQNEPVLGFYFDITKKSEKEDLLTTHFLRKKYQDLFFAYWDTDEDFTVVNVSPKDSSKWNVIKKLQKRYNFKEIITFGNGYTDVEMIKKADIGFAMQNAFDSVKKYANKVTEFDNDHNGVALELDKIIG